MKDGRSEMKIFIRMKTLICSLPHLPHQLVYRRNSTAKLYKIPLGFIKMWLGSKLYFTQAFHQNYSKIKKKWLYVGKDKKQRIPRTNDYRHRLWDDIELLANTPAQDESLLHSLERAAGSIGLHVNADKTDFMSYNQRGDISTLNGISLKLVNKFTYLGSNVSSTENDINSRLAKAWTAIDRQSVIWKTDLLDKIKCSFFQVAIVSIRLYGFNAKSCL